MTRRLLCAALALAFAGPATAQTLNWANGDTAPKAISIPIFSDHLPGSDGSYLLAHRPRGRDLGLIDETGAPAVQLRCPRPISSLCVADGLEPDAEIEVRSCVSRGGTHRHAVLLAGLLRIARAFRADALGYHQVGGLPCGSFRSGTARRAAAQPVQSIRQPSKQPLQHAQPAPRARIAGVPRAPTSAPISGASPSRQDFS